MREYVRKFDWSSEKWVLIRVVIGSAIALALCIGLGITLRKSDFFVNFDPAMQNFVGHVYIAVSLLVLVGTYRVLVSAKLRTFLPPVGLPRINDLALSIGGVVLLYVLCYLTIIFTNTAIPTSDINYVMNTNGSFLVALLTIAIAAPISEELFHRLIGVFVFMKFFWVVRLVTERSFVTFYVLAAIVAAVTFSLIHTGNRGLIIHVYYVLLGLWLSYCYFRSGNLINSILGHSTAGLLAVLGIWGSCTLSMSICAA